MDRHLRIAGWLGACVIAFLVFDALNGNMVGSIVGSLSAMVGGR